MSGGAGKWLLCSLGIVWRAWKMQLPAQQVWGTARESAFLPRLPGDAAGAQILS